MNISEYFRVMNEKKPMFVVLYCPDASLKSAYVDKFISVHGGRPVYREELETTKQPRIIGKKPVYIITNWDPGIKKPNPKYLKTNQPTMLFYSRKGPIPESVREAYQDMVFEVPEVTGEQATRKLKSIGVPENLIDFLKEKTDNTQEAILIGEQLVSLSSDLNMKEDDCFNQYFRESLRYRNVDEEPTEFLDSILNHRYTFIFEYLYTQRGNEFYVYAALLNWIEDIIKFSSCNGDYWNDAGLVAARYKPFAQHNVNKVPFTAWVKVYEECLSSMHSLKQNESEPGTALEVFVCSIIRLI